MASHAETPARSAAEVAAERSPQTSATEEATEDATESATEEDEPGRHNPPAPSLLSDDEDWRGERTTRWHPAQEAHAASSSASRVRATESARPAQDSRTALLQAVAGVPTQEHNAYWLYVTRAMLDPDATDVDDEAGSGDEGVQSTSGKWMLFYRPDRVDRYWLRAVELLGSRQLVGVHAMKVSTARPNPRASSNAHVLIFYVKPCTNRAKVMAAGHRILELFSEYSTLTNYLYYKTDVQTLGGTRATGQTRNWLYRIRLPASAAAATATSTSGPSTARS